MRRARFAADGTVQTGRYDDDTIVTDTRTYETGDVTVLPPCEPSKIVAGGKNYPDHLAEMAEKGFGEGEPPEFPFLFFKPPSSMIGHGADVVYPEGAETVHFEGEVAVVVGERCRSVAPEDALDVLGIDVTPMRIKCAVLAEKVVQDGAKIYRGELDVDETSTE